MIVGTREIPHRELREACRNIQALQTFATNLVPRPFRHIDRIVCNQKYLVAVAVRNITAIPYTRRKELCEGLLQGVSVNGIVNVIFDVQDLLMRVDTDLLYTYLFHEDEED